MDAYDGNPSPSINQLLMSQQNRPPTAGIPKLKLKKFGGLHNTSKDSGPNTERDASPPRMNNYMKTQSFNQDQSYSFGNSGPAQSPAINLRR